LLHIGSLVIFPADIPWQSVSDQLLGMVQPALTQSGSVITQIATTTFRIFIMVFFIFMVSVYIAIEIPLIGGRISGAFASPGYQYDAERLFRDFGRVWSSYLRGQVVLGLVIFVIVWLGLSILGVRYALALAILAGLLEFVPNVGAIISTAIAMLVTVFQPENYLGMTPLVHMLVVLGFMFVIQQLENNLLVPRIMGNALNLHPLIVIIGVFIGGSTAGILGAVLAAPIVASVKLVGTYSWHKLFDLPPFTTIEDVGVQPSIFNQGRGLATQFTGKIRAKQEEE
jgi:predicted PurR-regulated permease PerM